MPIGSDYEERVYAGVLGKLIGVYLGRPFEGWSYQRIMDELGEVNYYVHDRLRVPLVVTDDDISGTFTFLRALPDYGNAATSLPRRSARVGSTTSSKTKPSCGGADWAIRPSIPPFCASSVASPLLAAARWRSTVSLSPSRSARRSSSTAGRWWHRATRNWPRTWRDVPAASVTTAKRSTARRCWRRWKRRRSWSPTSSACWMWVCR